MYTGIYILYYTVHVYSIFWIQITIIHKYYIYTVGEEDKWVSLTCARKWYLWSRQEHGPREQHLVEVFESTSSFYINKKKKKKKKKRWRKRKLYVALENTLSMCFYWRIGLCVYLLPSPGVVTCQKFPPIPAVTMNSQPPKTTRWASCALNWLVFSLSLSFFFLHDSPTMTPCG